MPRRSADKPVSARVAVGRTSADRLAQERGHREFEAVSYVSAAYGEVRPTSRCFARVAVGRTSSDRLAWERGHREVEAVSYVSAAFLGGPHGDREQEAEQQMELAGALQAAVQGAACRLAHEPHQPHAKRQRQQ